MARINIDGFEFDDTLSQEEIFKQHANYMKSKISKENEEKINEKISLEREKWNQEQQNNAWASQFEGAKGKLASKLLSMGMTKEDILNDYPDMFAKVEEVHAMNQEKPKQINIESVLKEVHDNQSQNRSINKPVSEMTREERIEQIALSIEHEKR